MLPHIPPVRITCYTQAYARKKPKGLSLDLGFQFFAYLGFEFEFEHFANFLQFRIR